LVTGGRLRTRFVRQIHRGSAVKSRGRLWLDVRQSRRTPETFPVQQQEKPLKAIRAKSAAPHGFLSNILGQKPVVSKKGKPLGGSTTNPPQPSEREQA
jgi:hypothetical protein